MGWIKTMDMLDGSEYAYYENLVGESVQILPAEGGGCTIHVITKPTTMDRVESWIWRQTHPSEGRRPTAAN